MTFYKLPFAQLCCAALFLTSNLISMETHQYTQNRGSNTSTAYSSNYITSEKLLAKPWVRKLLVCVSMIANCCRYCERDDVYEYEVSENVPSAQTSIQPCTHTTQTSPSPTVQPAASQLPPVSPALLDDASIKQYYERDKATLEDAFAQAPQRAKNLVHMLNNQSLYKIVSRLRVLYGDSGVGKSTLARAIAYKAGWYMTTLYGRQVRNKHRGNTSIRLQKKLESIITQRKNTIIVIDEMNRLFEEYNNSNYDTGDTAEDFWTFLDDQRNNTQVYIIGTMNKVDKLPPQIQSRARGAFIKLIRSDALTETVRILKRMCTEDQYILDPAYTDEALKRFLTPLQGNFTLRDYETLICNAIELARKAHVTTVPVVVTKAHLEAAKNEFEIEETDTNYGEEHETRNECEERRHQENLQMHRDNFVRGIVIQKSLNTNQLSTSANFGVNAGIFNGSWSGSATNLSRDDATITNHLSDDEIKIYREQQQLNTQRNDKLHQLQILINTVRTKINYLTTAQKRLTLINSDEATSFVTQISTLIATHKQAHAVFDELKIPSVTEITTMRTSLHDIDEQATRLQTAIKASIAQQSNCIIS